LIADEVDVAAVRRERQRVVLHSRRAAHIAHDNDGDALAREVPLVHACVRVSKRSNNRRREEWRVYGIKITLVYVAGDASAYERPCQTITCWHGAAHAQTERSAAQGARGARQGTSGGRRRRRRARRCE